MTKKEPESIHLQELFAELDSLRGKLLVDRKLTEEQEKALLYAREKSPPVPWERIRRIARRDGWAVIHPRSLKEAYEKIKNRESKK